MTRRGRRPASPSPTHQHKSRVKPGWRLDNCGVALEALEALDWPLVARCGGHSRGGAVRLVRDDKGKTFTLRSVPRGRAQKRGAGEALLREKRLLTTLARAPGLGQRDGYGHVAATLATASGKHAVFVLSEALPGGDLYGLLHEETERGPFGRAGISIARPR